MRHLSLVPLVFVGLVAAEPIARGQTTYTWTGTTNGSWNTGTNWNGGVPANSLTLSDVAFDGTSNLVTTVDLLQGSGGGTYSLRTLTFNAGAGTFSITPSSTNVTSLQIGTGGIVVNSPNAQTISNPLIVGAGHTWNAASGSLFVNGPVTATGQTLTFDGANAIKITGNVTGGTLVKNGAGATTLSGNNTPTAVTVNAGTLIANQTGAGSPIGTAPVSLAGGTLSFRASGNPIAVTGFNHDVITAVSELAGGTPYGTDRAVDGNNGDGSFVYFEQGVYTTNTAFGLPHNGQFQGLNNPAVTYQMGSYTGNNVLSIGSSTAGSAATTLTLATPGSYRTINIMNVTGSGSATYSFTLNFADSTSTTVSGNTSPDWFGTDAAQGAQTLFKMNARLNRGDGSFDQAGNANGNPRIYGTDYNLSAADRLKTLNSITFATTNTGTYTLNVFGLSGTSAPDTQVFTNNLTVTADSTLDQQNVSSVTLGPLSIGTNVLTTTGTAGSTMTVGAATLTGNPTFSPQSGSTLVLGALTGGATSRTITKTGAGTLTLGTTAASLATGSVFNANAGTTNLNAAGAIGTATALNLSAGATVALGANQTVATLGGTAGGVTLGTNALTIAGGAASTYGGGMTGGSVVVSGAGTNQTLTGTTFGTAFTVQNGGRLAAAAGYSIGSGGVTLSNTSTLSLGLGSATTPTTFTGFGTDGTGWNLLGNNISNPTVTNNVLTITTANGSIANAAWNQTAVPVGPFAASFRYSQTAGTGGADGFTFTIQNSGALAVGGNGGGLGYTGIPTSAAIAVEIFSGAPPGFKYGTNGNLPGAYTPVSPVVLTNAGAGNEITFNLLYDGSTLSGSLAQGANVFNLPPITINLATVIGNSTAFVGFTGGTGGSTALQTIDNFSFSAPPNGSVYSAPITLSDGAVATIAVNFNALRSTATVPSLTVGNGASLTVQADTGTAANTAYGLTVSGATSLSGGTNTFTVNNNGTGTGTLTLNGVVSGSSALTKAGAGTLVMKAANTYNGNTSINAGTLTLTGSGSFAGSQMIFVATGATLNGSGVTGGANFDGTRFALANNQTLQGNGTVVGPLGISAGSTISPGTTPAKLTINGGLTFTGGTYSVVINGPAVSQYDQIAVAGNVALGAGVATLATPSPGGNGYTTTTVLAIITNTGTSTTTTGNFSGLATDGSQVTAMNGLGGFNWGIYYHGVASTGALTGGQDVLLAVLPVPEPVTVLGFAAAGLGLVRFARRRR
jgi:autotransporter-associated beta strand protein